jgi:hypothetical protein
VKTPKVKEEPMLPFSKAEMARILDACDRYRGDQDRLRAFVLVMRHSGMRIGDTIALDENRLKGNKLLLYTANRHARLCAAPAGDHEGAREARYNRCGRVLLDWNAKPQTARANWSLYLDSLFALAKIDGGHSH